MSFTDFLIRPGLNNTFNPLTGSAQLNSALSSPLTSSQFCRVTNPNGLNNTFHALYILTGSQYVNIPETKSVSLRVWHRLGTIYQAEACLIAKHNGRNNHFGVISGSFPASGYEFGYEENSGRYFANFGGAQGAITNLYTASAPGQQGNVWTGLRMDIVPVKANYLINNIPVSGNFKDIVTLYTASVSTPDNWVQVYKTEILATDSKYVPWGTYKVEGSGVSRGSGTTIDSSSYGFVIYTNAFNRGYFDDFNIFVEDAF